MMTKRTRLWVLGCGFHPIKSSTYIIATSKKGLYFKDGEYISVCAYWFESVCNVKLMPGEVRRIKSIRIVV